MSDYFYFLGAGPPSCSILCQFWLCQEAQCVYLRLHLGFSQNMQNLFKENFKAILKATEVNLNQWLSPVLV